MIHQEGLDLIKEFEGLHRIGRDGLIHVYPDAGYGWKWATQGYGSTTNEDTGRRLKRGDPPIDKATAERWLAEGIAKRYEPAVRAAVKVPLSEISMSALVSFAYNVGVSGFRRSTVLKRVNRGDFHGVPEALSWWNKSNGRVFRGLTRRRTAEGALFMKGLKEAVSPPPNPNVEFEKERPSKNVKPLGLWGRLFRAFLSWAGR